MTLILAAAERDGAYIGADARSSSNTIYSDNAFKMVRIHNYIVGVAGSTRVNQLVKYQADVFSPIENDADMFLFSAALKQLLADDYEVRTGFEKEDQTFTLLMATQVGIYCLYRTFQFELHQSWAIGSGDSYGLGYYRGMSLDDTALRVQTAIQATAAYVHSVGGETTVWKL